jgi:glycosyltransferase involved in cell wall biosynthesis
VTSKKRDDFGVVVIGRNEGERLLKCLASIHGEAEHVIYVDSGSTDESPAAVEQLGIPVVQLDKSRPFSAARGRNEGFAALKERKPELRFVQFIDGDCQLVHGWLATALKYLDNHADIAIVFGRRREIQPKMSVYNRLCDIEWNTPIGEALSCGGDSLVRVEAFEAVHGFRPQLIAHEEPELGIRLRAKGWKIWRLDADMTLHDAAIRRFAQWWARTVRSGYGYAEVSKLHSGSVFWGPETIRTTIWAGVVPLFIGLGAIIYLPIAWSVLIYPLQICRMALRRGPADTDSWLYATFIMLAKFSEFQGVLTYYWRVLMRRKIELIEYKQPA